jgi:hypothetical protein
VYQTWQIVDETRNEVMATPGTYWLVNKLKRAEGIDVYDRNTDFRAIAVSG